MTTRPSLEERFVGCLLGGACGDALGSAVEFLPSQQIIDKYGAQGIRDFEKLYDYPGAFTDDTQMTLFTAEGLISSILSVARSDEALAKFKAEDAVPGLHQSYLRWLATQNEVSQSPLFQKVKNLGMLVTQEELRQRRGPGQTCRIAIKSGAVGSEDNKINGSKGCGGIMRVAPCGLIVHSAFKFLSDADKADLAFKIGSVSAAITHSHPSGWLPAGFLASVIAWIISGTSLEDAIDRTIPQLQKNPNSEETLFKVTQARRLAREFMENVGNSHISSQELSKKKVVLDHIRLLGRGFVGEEALAITLYSALVCDQDLEIGICFAVNHGGDSDSTGAMTGNVLGALLGEVSIPQRWSAAVELGDLIREVSCDLLMINVAECEARLLTKYPLPVKIHNGEEYYKNKANLVTPPFQMPPGSKFFDWANSR